MNLLSQIIPEWIQITPKTLLFSPRIFLFLLSLIPDHLIALITKKKYYQTKVLYGNPIYHLTFFLIASLWPVILFHTRTFSNTIESFMLVIAFYCYFSVRFF